MRRKHRRVHHPQTDCRCPENSKRVETCGKKGDPTCRGRNMGCIQMVLPPNATKEVPRFVKPECGPEAGPVVQWKPKVRKPRKKKPKSGVVMPPEQIVMRLPDESLPLLRRLKNRPSASPLPARQTSFKYDEPLFNRARAAASTEDKPSIPPWWRT